MRKLLHWLSTLVAQRVRRDSWRDELRAELNVRSLEERLVFHAAPMLQLGSPTAGGDAATASSLQVSLNDAGQLRIEDVSGGATNDHLNIALDAHQGRIEVTSTVAASLSEGDGSPAHTETLVFDANLVSSIEIVTADGDDSVAIQVNGTWNGSIDVQTGTGNDQLELTGAAQAVVAYQWGDDASGRISVGSLDSSLEIQWHALEKISDGLAAERRTFEFTTEHSGSILLDDAGRPGADTARLQVDGTSVVFALPAERLDVNFAADEAITNRLAITGDIDLESADLNIAGTRILVDGSITSAGGQIELSASEQIQVSAQGRLVSASGRILLDGGAHGTVEFAGAVDVSNEAANAIGGEVRLTAENVRVSGQAVIDADGTNGGGRVYIGGGYQGGNAEIRNALNTYFAADAAVHADALENGDGGIVVIWADADAVVAGSGHLSARGGRLSGNGGLIETSGKNWLSVNGAPDARAPHGRSGLWFLDPRNVTVVDGGTATLTAGVLTPTANNTLIDASTIIAALKAGTSVTINTGTTGTQDGDIVVSENILVDAGATDVTLTLDAADDITISNSIISTAPKLSIVLQAGTGNVNIDAAVTTKGGNFSSTGAVYRNTAVITTNGGNVAIAHNGDVLISNDINAGSAGTAALTSTSGNISFTANCTLSAAAATLSAAQNVNSGLGSVDIDTSTANGNIQINSTSGNIGTVGNRFAVSAGTGQVSLSTIATRDASITSPDGIRFGNVTTRNVNALAGLSLTQTAGTTITAAGSATLSAGATGITLTQGNSFVSLTFTSVGNVSITESDSMSIVGTNTAAGLLLTSTGGAIANTNTSSIIATGNTRFVGTSIDIGRKTADTFQTASLTFNAAGSVDISENNSTTFSGSSTAGNLTLQSGGAILSGAAAVDVTTTGTLTLTPTGGVGTAGNHVVVSAAGDVTITTTGVGGDIFVDSPAALLLGAITTDALTTQSVNFATSAGAISLDAVTSNDDWMLNAAGALTFSGNFTGQAVNASSGGAMTQANATGVTVTTAEFLNTGAGTITLDQNNSFTTLNFNSPNAVNIRETTSMSVVGTNTAGALTLNAGGALSTDATASLVATGATSLNGTSIDIGSGAGNTFRVASLQFNSAGTVTIEEDDGTALAGASTSGALTLRSTGAIASGTSPLDIAATGATTLTAGGAIGAAGDRVTITSAGTVTAATTGPGGDIFLTGAGALSFGAISTENATAQTVDLATTAGDLTLTVNIVSNDNWRLDAAGDLAFKSLSGASLYAAAGGAITQEASSSLTITGAASFNTTTQSITLDQTNQFGSLNFNSGGAVNIHETNATQLTGANTADSLTLTTDGDITQSGGSLTVTNNAFIHSTAGAITLNQGVSLGSLRFVATGAAAIQETNATDLTGTCSAASLVLTSGGAITQSSGTLTITANAKFTDGAGAGITVNRINSFGSLSFDSTGVVTIVESNAMQLLGANAAGTLTLTAAGALTQSGGSLDVSGDAFFITTSGGITLNQGVRLGTLRFNSPGAVTIVEADATTLFGACNANSLSLTSAGAITQPSGNFTITNNAFFADGGGAGISVNKANTFGSLSFNSTGVVEFHENNATALTGANTAGSLDLNSGGAVTQTGTLTVTGNALFTNAGFAITVDQTNQFGSLSFNSGGAVTIREANATQLVGANTANSLSLTSGGALTQSGGSLNVTNTALFQSTAGGITLNQSVSLGSLQFVATGAVDILETGATDLVGSSAANSLLLTSTAAITQSGGGVTVTNNARFVDGAGAGISVDDANAFGSVSFNSTGAVTINESDAMQLAGANSAAGLTLTAGGAITQSGGSLNVGGAGFFTTSAGGITLDQAVSLGTLRFNSPGAVTIVEVNATDLAGASAADSLQLTSGGAITQSSTGLTITNNARFADGAGAGITLDKTNAFGSLSFNSTGAILIAESGNTSLVGANTAGSLSLTSTGTIIQGAASSLIVTGNALFTNAASAVTVDQTNNQFGSLTFNSGGAVTIREANDTLLQGVNTANSLSLISGGNLSQSPLGSLLVTNAAFVQSTTANITLDQTVGLGSLQFNAVGSVVVSETGNTDLSGASVANSLQLTSTGGITQSSGTLTIAGNARFTDGLGLGISVTRANALGSASFNSTGVVAITEADGMQLSGANTAGTLTLTAGGAMTQNGGSLIVAGGGFFITSAGGITLDQAVSLGTLRFNSPGAVTVVEVNDTTLAGASSANSLFITSAGAITQPSGNITVTGNARFVDGGGLGIIVDKANTFGTLSFNSAGLVSIHENNATTLSGANTANSLVISSGGAITQSGGSLTVNGNGSFTNVGGGITLDQAVSLGSLQFNSSGAVTVTESDGTDLTGANVANSLALTSGGAITQSAGTLTITSNARFADGGGGITLDKVNAFGSLGFTSTAAVLIRETGNMDLSGANSAGTLTLQATGSISQAGGSTLAVGGTAVVSGTAITLNQTNQFGSITFNSAGTVTITESDGTLIDGINSAGALILESGGVLTNADGAGLIVVGNTRLTGGSIDVGNRPGDLFRTGSLRFNSTGAVTIFEDDGTTLEGGGTSGSLLLVSGGPITSGAAPVDFTANGNVQLSANGPIGDPINKVAFTVTGGVVNVTTLGPDGNIFLSGVGGFTLGTVNTDPATAQTVNIATTGGPLIFSSGINSNDNWLLDVAGMLTLETLSTFSLAATASGNIVQAAGSTLTIVDSANFASTGGGSITLDRPNQFGTVNFNTTGGVTLVEMDATEIIGVNTAGDLSVTSGAAVHEGPAVSLTVAGNARFADAAGAGIVLDGVNRLGSVTLVSLGNVSLTEADGTTFAGASSTAGLIVNSAGAVTESPGASLVVNNQAAFTAGNGGITLDQVNQFGSIVFATAGGVFLREADATLFSGANVAATLTVVSAGSISQTPLSSLTIGGVASFADGGGAGITLQQINAFGSLTVNSTGAVVVTETDGTQLAGANTAASLNLLSSGAITEAGGTTLTVTNTAAFATTAGGAVTLNQTNRFGKVTFNTSGNFTLQEADDTLLTGVNNAATLSLISAGAISEDAGTSITVTGLAAISAGPGGILLGQNNRFGSLTFNSSGTVTLHESDDIALVGAGTAGTLNLSSTGAINESPGASLVIGGAAAFTSGGGSGILLTQTNRFGTLTVNSNGVVNVVEADATLVAGANTAATLQLQSAGNISNAAGASVIVAGNTKFVASAVSFGTQSGDSFFSGSLTFTSPGAVTIAEDDNLTLDGASTSGPLSLRSGGAIQSGAAAVDVAVGGNADFTALGPIGAAGNPLSLTVSGVLTLATQSPGGDIFVTSPNGLTLGGVTTNTTGIEAVNIVTSGGPLVLTAANSSNDAWLLQASGDVSFAVGSLLRANAVNISSGGTIRNLDGGLNIDTQAASGLIALSGAAGVGTAAAPLQIAAGDGELRFTSTNGGIFINAVQGDLKFSKITTLSAGASNADISLSTSNGDILVDGVTGMSGNLLNDHLQLNQRGATHNVRFTAPTPLQVGRITIVAAGTVSGGAGGPDVDTSSTNSLVSIVAAAVGEAGNPFAVNAGTGQLQVRATTGDLGIEVWGGDVTTGRLTLIVADQAAKNVEIASGDGNLIVDSLAGILAADDHLHLRAGGLNRDLIIPTGVTVRADQVHLSASGNLLGGAGVSAETTGPLNRLELTAGGTIGTAINPFRVDQGLLFTNSIGDQFLATPTRLHVAQLISQGANGPLPPPGTVFLTGGDWVLNAATTSSLVVDTGVRLEGGGNVNGDLTVRNAAFISPGDGAGRTDRIFIAGNLLLQPTSELILDLNAPFTTPGVDFDELIVAGNVGLQDSILKLVGGQAVDTRAIGAIKLIDVTGPGSTVTGQFQVGQGAIGPDSKIRVGTISSNIGYTLGDGNDIVLRDVTVSSPIAPDAAPPQLRLPVYTSNFSRPVVLDIPPAQAVAVVDPPLEPEQEQTNVRKVLLMRLTPIDDEGNFEEQTLLRLEADWLKNLSAVFKSLPDDRYRLVLQLEGGELRRVMDVIIRAGRPFEPEPVQEAGLGEMPSDVVPDASVDGQTEVNTIEEISLPGVPMQPEFPADDASTPPESDELHLNPPDREFRRGGMAAVAAAAAIHALARPWREDLEHALERHPAPVGRRIKRWWRRPLTPRN